MHARGCVALGTADDARVRNFFAGLGFLKIEGKSVHAIRPHRLHK